MGERILAIPEVSTEQVGIACSDALGWRGLSFFRIIRGEGPKIYRFYGPDTVYKIENGSFNKEYPRDFAIQSVGLGLHHLSYNTTASTLGTISEKDLWELIERRREEHFVYRFIKGVEQIKGRLRLWLGFPGRSKT